MMVHPTAVAMGWAIFARPRCSFAAMPANIHLFLPLSPLLGRKDAIVQVFSSISSITGLRLEFTCTIAGILSSTVGRQKIHVQMQVFRPANHRKAPTRRKFAYMGWIAEIASAQRLFL
ncbi:hypothetical protein ACFSR7_35445 [Cohnella sp. GCM10020058]|uniref:hypothetical protein n=1 Tax=Cohnella sp. GCM10020058 TaxID=3317330 RepID=UPI00363F0763